MNSDKLYKRPRASFPGTLYARLGGLKVLNKVVDKFFLRIRADQRFSGYLKDRDVDVLSEGTKIYLAQAMGGPTLYEGPDARDALSSVGLTKPHIKQLLEHLEAALHSARTPRSVSEELLDALSPIADPLIAQAPEAEERGGEGAVFALEPVEVSEPPSPRSRLQAFVQREAGKDAREGTRRIAEIDELLELNKKLAKSAQQALILTLNATIECSRAGDVAEKIASVVAELKAEVQRSTVYVCEVEGRLDLLRDELAKEG